MFDFSRLPDDLKVWLFNELAVGDYTIEDYFNSFCMMPFFVDHVFKRDGAAPDRFINCIKAVRTCLGLGLKESKDLVEQYRTSSEPRVNMLKLAEILRDRLAIGEFRGQPEWLNVTEVYDLVSAATLDERRVDIAALKDAVVDLIVNNES